MDDKPKWAQQQERDNNAIYNPEFPVFWDPAQMENLFEMATDVVLDTTGKFVHYGIVLGAVVYVCLKEREEK